MRKGFFFIFILSFFFAGAAHALPTYSEVRQASVKSDSLLLDRHGEIIHELRVNPDFRQLDWTPLQNISPAMKEAVIQAEDKRFYEHSGVDYQSIGGAILHGFTSTSLRGASTITMQLVSMLEREIQPTQGRRSLWQKARQVLAAWKMEKSWSKDKILEAYLNLIFFRGELRGVASASRGFFGKDPHGLDRAEALILASLIRFPEASSTGVTHRAVHLGQSLKWGVEDQDISSRVRQIFLGPKDIKPQVALAPHVAKQLLRGRPGGSSVICTLDRGIQRLALERLQYHLLPLRAQNVRDGAMLIVENRTGEILAYVSCSGDPAMARFVDGVQARRQAGSTLKPFLYALAFDGRILTPASLLDDSPLDVAVSSGVYRPRNYDSQFQGLVPVRVALASSLNVPAVRALSLVGLEPFLNKLRNLGIKGLSESGDFYGPSLALGSADVTLWELVNAYRSLANGGEWSEPRLTIGEKASSAKKQAFSREAAFLVSDILSDRQARSITFGLENSLATRFWTAVKTGTSKDMRDNWCIGYSRKYTVGVWVGNFSGEPMWNVSGVSGAAPVWIEVMNWLHRRDAGSGPPPPANLVRAKICSAQGVPLAKEEWFIRGTESTFQEPRGSQYNARIVYPPSGSVIALDPDIPPGRQKIFFSVKPNGDHWEWRLNGRHLGKTNKAIAWAPQAGKYDLAIVDPEGRIIDSVRFKVQGSDKDGPDDEEEF